MVFAEGIFEGETHVLHPKDSEVTSRLDVALYPPRDVPVDIHIKVKEIYIITIFTSNELFLLLLSYVQWKFVRGIGSQNKTLNTTSIANESM
jgi:hypothetical protein